MVSPLSRLTDIGVGPHCTITTQITASPNVITEVLPQSRLLDLHFYVCCVCGPGIGFNCTASNTVIVNGLGAHRINDLQALCTIEIKITGGVRSIAGGP